MQLKYTEKLPIIREPGLVLEGFLEFSGASPELSRGFPDFTMELGWYACNRSIPRSFIQSEGLLVFNGISPGLSKRFPDFTMALG